MRNIIKDLLILIPAFNEGKYIKKVLLETNKLANILVIDDGSNDETLTIAKKYAKHILQNSTNKGYDYTIIKGLKWSSKISRYKYVMTFDADNQHRQKYIKKLYKKISNSNYDCVIGSRNYLNRKSEYIISSISKKIFKISDPLTGMKIYNMNKIKKKIRQIDEAKVYLGMHFLILDINYSSIKINVNKKKKSIMGFGLKAEILFIKAFIKILIRKIFFQ